MNFGKLVKSQCNFLKYHEYDHSPKDYGLGMLCSYTCNAPQNFNITNPIGNLQRYWILFIYVPANSYGKLSYIVLHELFNLLFLSNWIVLLGDWSAPVCSFLCFYMVQDHYLICIWKKGWSYWCTKIRTTAFQYHRTTAFQYHWNKITTIYPNFL